MTGITVNCTTNSYTLGGAVIGLLGSGLVLQNNGEDDLAISTDGTFTFSIPIKSGDGYSVSILSQPNSPTQICNVSGGTGISDSANGTYAFSTLFPSGSGYKAFMDRQILLRL